MQRLIFVNRYFFPDHSATGQILSDLSFELAAVGQDVHVITSRQRYDEPDAALAADEIVNGVKVHRVASTEFGRSNLFGRAADYLSFYRSACHRLGEIMRPGDAVIAKTDPPLLSVAVTSTVRWRQGRLVNWLQDIYPETATVLGVPMIRGPVAAALRALRNRALQNADATIVVGETMARRIATFGIAAARIHVIPNWCDDEAIRPVAAVDNPLREAWQVADKFVVGYSGNLGRAHEFETILATAEQFRDEPRIAFLMIGGGRGFEDLARAVKARGLESLFRFRSYQERAMLPFSLGVPDVHWLSLNPQLEGLVVPSKFYGIAAAGRPIVMIGDREGEIARLVRRHRCGISVAPGEFGILAQTLRHWLNAPQAIGEMGARARQMLDAQFTRRQAFDQWRRLLNQLASPLTAAA
jgi:glycosyltransferase involved in cell wall biosynthesis